MSNLAQTQVQNQIVTETVKDFMKKNGYNQFNPTVVKNVNGYLFVTFINREENTAENVYFSKNASADFQEGQPIISGFFKDLQIGYTTNASGEERVKLVKKGGKRIDATDDLFE